jgi:hypothetical protein
VPAFTAGCVGARVTPNHWQYFHSIAFALAVAFGIRRVYMWEAQTDWDRVVRAALLVGGAAYLGQLARDAFTAKGLPLLRASGLTTNAAPASEVVHFSG